MERLISLCGLVVMLGFAWALSSNRSRVSGRAVLGGVALQFVFALLILKAPGGREVFDWFGGLVEQLLANAEEGSALLFGINPRSTDVGMPPREALLRTFAFGVLPTIVFFSALMSALYHLGTIQLLVGALAWVMRRTLRTSGAETLAAAANVFVGQTEAPLVIRPYLDSMTLSELMVVMVGGFATIAGGVLAIYISLGADAGHMLVASVISAPAALVVAKVMEPEIGEPVTVDSGIEADKSQRACNLLEATTEGVTAGLQLALNVGGMLIAFVALVAMANSCVGAVGEWFGFVGESAWTVQAGFARLFAPVAWLMGVDWKDSLLAGQMIGEKIVLNEFFSYFTLGEAIRNEQMSERSITIMTYALCGFANFSSIGIQVGGIGALAPSRRSDLAKIGFRAMIGGCLATFMTACVAGVLL